MIEGYCTEEAIKSGGPFCNNVLKDQVVIGLPPSRHEGRLHGSGRIGRKSFIPPDYNRVLEAHHIILRQLSIMEHLIEQHMNELQEHNPRQIDDLVMKEHKKQLYTLLREQDITYGETIEKRTIKALASRPSRQVITWKTYDIRDSHFIPSPRTKRAWRKIVVFDARP